MLIIAKQDDRTSSPFLIGLLLFFSVLFSYVETTQSSSFLLNMMTVFFGLGRNGDITVQKIDTVKSQSGVCVKPKII